MPKKPIEKSLYYQEYQPIVIHTKKWRVYWHNDEGPDDGVQKSEEFDSELVAQNFYESLGGDYAKIIVSDRKVIKTYGGGYYNRVCE